MSVIFSTQFPPCHSFSLLPWQYVSLINATGSRTGPVAFSTLTRKFLYFGLPVDSVKGVTTTFAQSPRGIKISPFCWRSSFLALQTTLSPYSLVTLTNHGFPSASKSSGLILQYRCFASVVVGKLPPALNNRALEGR